MHWRSLEGKALIAGLVGSVAFVALAAGNWALTAQAQPAKPGESVVTFSDPSFAEQGPVEFSHPAHKKAWGQEKLDCKPCHFQQPALFPMKKPKEGEVMKMSDMAEGKYCGKCHDGKTAINGKTAFSVTDKESCGRCHHKG
jgi:c(7)-type cytochrome triheme protein